MKSPSKAENFGHKLSRITNIICILEHDSLLINLDSSPEKRSVSGGTHAASSEKQSESPSRKENLRFKFHEIY